MQASQLTQNLLRFLTSSRMKTTVLVTLAAAFVNHTAAKAYDLSAPGQRAARIHYEPSAEHQRQLIFMNNPEFLWLTREACDLADEFPDWRRLDCSRSLFSIRRLAAGSYRAWWEHRNMMPFGIRSGILLSNNSPTPVTVVLNNEGIETNSFRLGGNEFVRMFNSPTKDVTFTLSAGERKFLGTTQSSVIRSGHYFAGVSDFQIIGGEVTLEEVVFQKQPAQTLSDIGYSQRALFGVRENLVYKGISPTSSVTLRGADFNIDDTTPTGALPIAYSLHNVVPLNDKESSCRADRTPACVGNALQQSMIPVQSSSWVTHIAPDPQDSNPKRLRAIVDDLVEMFMPNSTLVCPSHWPQDAMNCMRMSARHYLYLNDQKTWRLPNWGNWAVHYSHPITITNKGSKERFATLRLTADGASPIVFRGTGLSDNWQQIFLNPNADGRTPSGVIIARATVPPNTTIQLLGEFILSGPGAGTLEHSVELGNNEDDFR
ncbi:MAG: hypothetical protein RLZZ488_1671 [Pseudomonadota bacterium]